MAAKLKHKESLKRESSKESSESSKKVEIGRKRMKKNEKEGKIDGKALKGFRKSSKEVFMDPDDAWRKGHGRGRADG